MFRQLLDNDPSLNHCHLLRAARLTLRYCQECGSLGLTKTGAFKRDFVHWAVAHFEWPGHGAVEMFRYSKVINEYEFQPLELLHFLLIELRLGRHFKGTFRLTEKGKKLGQSLGLLFAELIPFFILRVDHASYSRLKELPFANWDIWLNVVNVEADQGTTEQHLFETFYGEKADWAKANWRETAAFSSCVLRPLEWVGFLERSEQMQVGHRIGHVFKTPLWSSALSFKPTKCWNL